MERIEDVLKGIKEKYSPQGNPEQEENVEQTPPVEEKSTEAEVVEEQQTEEKEVNTSGEAVVEDDKASAVNVPDERYLEIEKENEELRKKLEELKEYFEKVSDPTAYFSSEEAFKAEQLKKVRKDLPDEVAKAAVGDIDKLGLTDLLVYDILMDVPNIEGGVEGAMELLMEKYGIDSFEDIPRIVKNKMLVDANRSKQRLLELRNSIPQVERPKVLDEVFSSINNTKEQVVKLEQEWQTNVPTVDKIVIKPNDGTAEFQFAIDSEFLEKAKQDLPKLMAAYGLDPKSPEAVERAKAEIKVAYLASNFERIAEEYANYRVTQALDKFRKENAGMVSKPKEGEPVSQETNVVNSAINAAKKAGLRI